MFDAEQFAYLPSGKDHRKCKSVAYNLAQSKSAQVMKDEEDQKLDYGSAQL